MITEQFFYSSLIAWIIHSSSQTGVQANNMFVEVSNDISAAVDDGISTHKQSTLNARKHPTRTISQENIKKLIKRAEEESDEEKDEKTLKKNSRRPTRTRKLSFAPEKIVDYKPKFHPV